MIAAIVEVGIGVAVGPGLADGPPSIDPSGEPDGGEPVPALGTPAMARLAVGPGAGLVTRATTTETRAMAPAMKKRRGRVDPRLGPA